ncbi:MAG: hypothetical protein M3O15_04015 [Acidobacteriota bacterium]|nr:hypothetical protein [Acidobacteriota bacterium]
MPSFGDVLAVLKDFQNNLEQQTQQEVEVGFQSGSGTMRAFASLGGDGAFATSLSNVHATGVGVRVKAGKVVPGEFVLKVYVFAKLPLGDKTPGITTRFNEITVDVEPLPVQLALAGARARAAAVLPPVIPAQRQRRRPIVGGLSIAPLNGSFVGTLGCFLRRTTGGSEQIFGLSNNHVMAAVNQLPLGTPIVQPGPEVAPTAPGDVFAALSAFTEVRFPDAQLGAVMNQLDAAVAIVSNLKAIKRGEIFGIQKYVPTLAAPLPGMRVTKSGRTTGVTTGIITATHVSGTQIDYGTRTAPRVATFTDTIEIVSDSNLPFSAPGDSGSVILEHETGRPVALLFAGDGRTTTACDLGAVCKHFQAQPI